MAVTCAVKTPPAVSTAMKTRLVYPCLWGIPCLWGMRFKKGAVASVWACSRLCLSNETLAPDPQRIAEMPLTVLLNLASRAALACPA